MVTTDRNRWEKCDNCGGDVPPKSLWGQPGERGDGYCPGHIREDDMCGAFASRDAYDTTSDAAPVEQR